MSKNDLLDILGQQPSLYKLYTQICCIYQIPDSLAHDRIVNSLRKGMETLTKNFPWLAGNVINEGASEGNTGTYRIIPSDNIPMVVKDLRTNPCAPTMELLSRKNFPISMIDEKIFAPCMTINIPGSTVGLVADTGPVFAVQVNFIFGGLVLTLVGQHNTMDMTGQGSIINLLNKACHQQGFSKEELTIGNLDKSKSITLFDESWEPGIELDCQMAKASLSSTGESTASASCVPKVNWGYIEFSASSLRALKTLAMQTVGPHSRFVSTDDAVTAFIWKSTSHSRSLRLKPKTSSTIARAVDVRQLLEVPLTYPGALTNMTYNTTSIQKLDHEPLGVIASQLRRKLDSEALDLVYNTRALATFLNRCPDKTRIFITAPVNVSSGIMLSSWAKLNLYDLDFNLDLGVPKAVRRPKFSPVESLVYIMPRSRKGEMVVALCLRDDDWKRLNADKEWMKFATYIG